MSGRKRTLEAISFEFLGHKNKPPGVCNVIRDIQYAVAVEFVTYRRIGQLVIGSAGNNLTAQLTDITFSEFIAEGARRVDIHRHGTDLVGCHCMNGRKRLLEAGNSCRVCICNNQLGAITHEHSNELTAELTYPLHAHDLTSEIIGTVDVLGRRFNRIIYA